MNKYHGIAAGVMLAMVLAGCGRDSASEDDDLFAETPVAGQADAPTATQSASPSSPRPSSSAPALEATVLQDGVLAVGSAVGANGAVNAVKASYAIGDTIHASVPTKGHPPGAQVAIYWFYQDGSSKKDEQKVIPAGAEYVSFTLSKADGMVPGQYNAQVDIGDAPVGIVGFTVE